MCGVRHRVGLTKIGLPLALYERLIEDARASAEFEVCGLIAGRADKCSAVYPIKNVSPTPRTVFFMDPREQVAAMNMMQQCGETMLGIYHSHPTTPALPSARDIAGAAYPGIAYLIISLLDVSQPEMAAFVLIDGAFEPITLTVND